MEITSSLLNIVTDRIYIQPLNHNISCVVSSMSDCLILGHENIAVK